MDNRLIIFFWTLGGTFAFALPGALFGGLAGWLNWRHGHASGTALARKVAEALARLRDNGLTDGGKAAVVGGADGALFLGLIGTGIGLFAGYRGEAPATWLIPAFTGLVLLLAGAVFFGTLAFGLVRLRTGVLLGFFLGGLGGALGTAFSLGAAHIVPGAVAGILVGTLLSWAVSGSRRG